MDGMAASLLLLLFFWVPRSRVPRWVRCISECASKGELAQVGGAGILALSSFCVVATTFENSWMAGLNFSCRSQMLASVRRRSLERMHEQ